MQKSYLNVIILFFSVIITGAIQAQSAYPIQAVPFTSVKIEDNFWEKRQETSKSVTIPYCFKKCEETGRISNFAKAGGLMQGDFEGIYFNDSDLYKVIEGAAYSLQNHPDPQLEKYVDGIIDTIAAAQWDDGYLYTYYSLPEHQPQKRWSNIESHHELYCAGHFYEAAVAYYRATGKRKILDMAVKNADLIDRVFGPDKKHAAPGHEEIEIGLIKLYQVTGEERYLKLAKFFLDERGRADQRKLFGIYLQDHKPLSEQTEAVGHAVRAGYLYSAMADVAAITGDKKYIKAIDRIWEDVVNRKLYITGGIGSERRHEAFGKPYELPNLTAYNETCAAIANVLWNYRMFMLHGEAKYLDVLERSLYNNVISGVSLSGDRFFYPNPLSCDGKFRFNHGSLTRSPWFKTSCCPVNIARTIPSVSGYIYARKNDRIYVNLYIGSSGKIEFADGEVMLSMRTDYPNDGKIAIKINKSTKKNWSLWLRIPGWARGNPLAGNLYKFLYPQSETISITVNGKNSDYLIQDGFAVIKRRWRRGDVLNLNIPMPVRRVIADNRVKDDSGRVAVLRGPLVYCAEGKDNNYFTRNLILPDNAEQKVDYKKDLLDGINRIKFNGKKKISDDNKSVKAEITLIPYYAWAQRGANEMTVWLPRNVSIAEWPSVVQPLILPRDTVVIKPGKLEVRLITKMPAVKIYFTTDGSPVTQKAQLYNSPIILSANTLLKYKAFKEGLKESETGQKYFAFVDEKVNGLNYAYYEGDWQKLPDFDNLHPLKTGIAYSLKPKPLSLKEDGWGLVFSGYIGISAPGEYTFHIESNDGSRLLIDGKAVVNNDGQHGIESKSGKIHLNKGKHAIRILYFESGGSEFLKLYYQGPGFDKMEVPASIYFFNNTN